VTIRPFVGIRVAGRKHAHQILSLYERDIENRIGEQLPWQTDVHRYDPTGTRGRRIEDQASLRQTEGDGKDRVDARVWDDPFITIQAGGDVEGHDRLAKPIEQLDGFFEETFCGSNRPGSQDGVHNDIGSFDRLSYRLEFLAGSHFIDRRT